MTKYLDRIVYLAIIVTSLTFGFQTPIGATALALRPDPIAKTTTFENTEIGFAFSYAEDIWQVDERRLEDSKLFVTLSARDTDEIITLVVMSNPENRSAQEWLNKTISKYNQDLVKVAANSRVIVAGREAIVLEQPDTCGAAAFIQVIVPIDNLLFEIGYIAPNTGQNIAGFKTLLESFHFHGMEDKQNSVSGISLPPSLSINCSQPNHQPIAPQAVTTCPGAPFMIPADGYVMSSWGCWGAPWCDVYSQSDPHKGIDIGPVDPVSLWGNGSPGVLGVYAPVYGVITYKTSQAVVLRSSVYNVDAYFAHMANNATNESYVYVSYGQELNAGNSIGKMGNYGTYETHLHYDIMRLGGSDLNWADSKDPTPYLKAQGLVFYSGWSRHPMVCEVVDTTPPTTSPSFFGTSGESGWFRSPVQITLSATDNPGGTGVAGIEYRIDNGNWTTYSSPISIDKNGTTTLLYRAWDAAAPHNMEPDKQASIKIDTVRPITTLSPSGTVGENNWYKSNVSITLTRSDQADGSGIYATEYKIDNNSWMAYAGAFTVSGEGAHTVYYHSRDVAGNWEGQKAFFVPIDLTDPTGTLLLNNGNSVTYSSVVNANLTGQDATSGVAAFRLRDLGGSWSSWFSFAPSTLWQLLGSTGSTLSVEGQFKDQAGRVSAIQTNQILLNIYPASPSSSNYRLVKSTFPMSANRWSSSNYKLNGSLGQSSPIGELTSSNYLLKSGYWDALTSYLLTVNKSGAGSGTVSSSPLGITCGADCTESFTPGTVVTLTATANVGSTFAGWSGACSGTGQCVVTMNAAKTVTADFSQNSYVLSLNKTGTGSGAVSSTPAGISCGSDCSETFSYNTAVTLTATANVGSTFTGWSGACSGTGQCVVLMNTAKSATANFNLNIYTLSVGKSGTGSGTVSSIPSGIACGADCSESFSYGTVVTLTATAGADSIFAGWNGACSGTGQCVLTVNAARSVTADFTQNSNYPLTVIKAGTGAGLVSSIPAGINCGLDCSEGLSPGTVIALTATPSAGSTFTGWSGACSGSGQCTITMDAAKTVTATFSLNSYLLSVAKTGLGAGTVASTPAGIDCGSDCSESFSYGTIVTLEASANAGSTFAGWSGACSGMGDCIVTIDAIKNVTANFSLNEYSLTVSKTGTGNGTVSSSPAGINCGAVCFEDYSHGTVVTLTATAGTGSAFVGWSGACSGTGQCVVTMDSAKNVSARFSLNGYLLSVNKTGTGSGTVSSTPAGIDCGTDCSESFTYGTVVTLNASAGPGSTFTGWSGACSGTGQCVVTIEAALSVTANFNLNSYMLTVIKTGTGSGTVNSGLAGISCGSDCSESFTYGTVVTLDPTADIGSTFVGWGGACSGTGQCVVTMTAAKNVTAEFSRNTYLLSISKAGAGSGWVSSTPAGIDCREDCTESFAHDTVVTLVATAATGSTFSGWGGACVGTGQCVVTMDAAKNVSASFNLNSYTLTVTKSGTGSGSVASTPAGISCGADCSENFNYGTVVTLTATPSAGSTFSGWSGACTGTNECVVTIDAAKNVSAGFNLNSYLLTVTKSGTGSGSVTSTPAGISCGADCSENFNYGTVVTLTAIPSAGSTFAGWSGACVGTGECVVTVDAVKNVGAIFTSESLEYEIYLPFVVRPEPGAKTSSDIWLAKPTQAVKR